MEKSDLNNINQIYEEIKNQIIERIQIFRNIWKNGSELDIFYELVFCLLTPQSKAFMADKAVTKIKKGNLLFTDDEKLLSDCLNIVRFKNNKAKYIIEAKKKFTIDNKILIRNKIDSSNPCQTRDNLVKTIKGIGYKEASHFFRNIGFTEEVAILDRHILKNLALLGVIGNVPKTLTPKIYFGIEKALFDFSNKINIPVGHLDFVLWYKEAGAVFK